jgi:hypothetical protein
MADNNLDPEQEQQPTQAQGAGSGLMGHWDSFIGHPENRAGLMQFAVNMLSGKGFGESVGGAAEASGRNIEAQAAAEKEEEAQDIARQKAEAGTTTAQAYAKGINKQGAGEDRFYRQQNFQSQLKGRMKAQADFEKWLGQDDAGVTDNRFEHIKTKFPNLKRKADIYNDPAAQRYARSMFSGADVGGEEGGTTVYDSKTGAPAGYWNGKRYVPGSPE